jgi:hypothetical protein
LEEILEATPVETPTTGSTAKKKNKHYQVRNSSTIHNKLTNLYLHLVEVLEIGSLYTKL